MAVEERTPGLDCRHILAVKALHLSHGSASPASFSDARRAGHLSEEAGGCLQASAGAWSVEGTSTAIVMSEGPLMKK